MQGAIGLEAGSTTVTTRIERAVKTCDDRFEVWRALGRRIGSEAGNSKECG